MGIKIALAGNPNSGKTTMFNELTGSAQYVGNWPGVTVEKKEGRLRGRPDVTIQDLPGIYSLSPYTLEEVVARGYLVSERPDAILNIVDATNIERNLYLLFAVAFWRKRDRMVATARPNAAPYLNTKGADRDMKAVILYYTFGGSTKKEAERLGAELSAPVYRVREAKNRSLLGSFIPGGFQARKRKPVKTLPVDADLAAFDRIYLGCPVWAGYPAPAFNAVLALLPAGKEVEVFLCAGGNDPRPSDAETKRLIEERGCTVTRLYTIATGVAPGKLQE